MNREQTGAIVSFLNRAGLLQALEGQTAVWHEVIGQLDFEDAKAACKQLSTERVGADRWVTPGDVIAAVRKIRSARIAGITAPAPPIPLNVDQDIAWRKAYISARADGLADQAAQESANRAHRITPPALVPAPPELRAIAGAAASIPDRAQETADAS